METKSGPKTRKGILSRIRKDQSGNVIAILAAAVVPAIGIVGGAVDMSRIFIVRTNMQSACDAGSLMGRRVMGSGTWTANDNKANTKAEQIFKANFGPGSYGSTDLAYSFTEQTGKVTGVASVKVPMALMSVFGIDEKPVSVTCDAEMRLPASDIMFVLDTTGSMNCPDDGSACPWGNNNGVEAPNAKMKGLRKAASCFYEALTKQNIGDYDAEDCGEETDPQGATSDVRLRFGFVPYSVNANVGRLLPLNYMKDQSTYQSREAVFNTTSTTTETPTYGDESAYTPSGSPTDLPLPDNNWQNKASNLIHTNGQTYSYYKTVAKDEKCASGNIPDETLTTQGTDYVFWYQTPDPVTSSHLTVTKYYRRTDGSARYLYKYDKYTTTTGPWNNKVTTYHCQLQYKTNQVKQTTRVFTTTTPVTWDSNTVTNSTFSKWVYKPVAFNVAGLKNTAGNSWNNSINLNLGDNGASTAITWNGCVEERETARITDSDPSDNWDPIPTTALDMDIETAPTSDLKTKWAPMLGDVIYTRQVQSNGGSATSTTNNFETTSNDIGIATYGNNWNDNNWHWYANKNYDADKVTEYCPTPAKLYSTMDAAAFDVYLDSLVTGGNTYHDTGLLWGARLMAPQGIFQAVTADTNNWTERHMIFMTDGDTSVFPSDYSMHGVHWWDRRQNNGTSGASQDWLEANVDARTQALCKWVRDENITLWVVAFGKGISAATKENLEDCATTGRYFEANDTPKLIGDFKKIANTIAALRLTN